MKNFLFLLFLTISLISWGQIQIQGHINIDTNKEYKLFLNENIGGKYYELDSCTILADGNYAFDRKLETGFYSIGFNDTNWIQFIVQEEEPLVYINFNSTDLRTSIQIINSRENKLLWDFMTYRKRMKSEISQAYMNKTIYGIDTKDYAYYQSIEDSLNRSYQATLLQLYQANSNTFFAKTMISDNPAKENQDFFIHTYFQDKELIRSGVLTRKVTEYLQFHTEYNEDGFVKSIDYILEKSSSNQQVYEFILNYLLELFNEVGPDIILDYLVEEYILADACSDLQTSDILSTRLHAYKKLQIGNKAPAISMFDTQGTLHNLYDLCSYTEINILLFGSSQCHFCEEAIPALENFSLDYDQNKLKIIYISLDTNYQNWVENTANHPENWISLSELKGWDSKSTSVFLVHKTPSFYILDQHSTIISKPKNTTELIEELEIFDIKKTRD